MNLKKRSKKGLNVPGMELIRGGIEATGDVGILGCICSPGGYEYGRDSVHGCACGCPGPSSPADNMNANKALAK